MTNPKQSFLKTPRTSAERNKRDARNFSNSPRKTPSKKFSYNENVELSSMLDEFFPSATKELTKQNTLTSNSPKVENAFDLFHPNDDPFADLFPDYATQVYAEPLRTQTEPVPEKLVELIKLPDVDPIKNSNHSQSNQAVKNPPKSKTSIKASTTSSAAASVNAPRTPSLTPPSTSLSDNEAQILAIINEVYQDGNGIYYLSLIQNLPTQFEPKITWAFIFSNKMKNRLRNNDKWKLLRDRLKDSKFIEENSDKLIKRTFE